MKPTSILLDVDAGVDDTLAIILALLSPRLEVKAITTVAGNVTVNECTRNVLLTLDLLSSTLRVLPPVVCGASRPLRRKLFTAREVHGSDGIGEASQYYPPPRNCAARGGAVDAIITAVKNSPGMTIVATGPLTNIAAAIARDRATMKKVREIVVMGGAFNGAHNTGPCAEFNFYVDPDAADHVLNSGIPIRLIPLNVTERCILTSGDVKSIGRSDLRRFVQRVTRFYFSFHKRTENIDGGYLHDPLAVGAVLEPSFLTTKRGYVRVETKGKYTRGVSVFFPRLNVRQEAELPGWTKRTLRQRAAVNVATGVDARRFKELFLKCLQ